MRASLAEELNFLITNRVPRRLLTQLAGWYSRIESIPLTRLSIAVWTYFGGDLRLEESEPQQFASVRDCFTRRLRAGARPVNGDANIVVSPCDAIVGAMGRIERATLIQAKGLTYSLEELLQDSVLAHQHEGGLFVTLRLRANMYHRFHAPCDARLKRVRFINGDTWNVNPIAVKRIERLFCRNERAVVEFEPNDRATMLTLVPVAAILVSGIRVLDFNPPRADQAISRVDCDVALRKGDEAGYFENGSTIIALISGPIEAHPGVREGDVIRMGQPLFRRVSAADSSTNTSTLYAS